MLELDTEPPPHLVKNIPSPVDMFTTPTPGWDDVWDNSCDEGWTLEDPVANPPPPRASDKPVLHSMGYDDQCQAFARLAEALFRAAKQTSTLYPDDRQDVAVAA